MSYQRRSSDVHRRRSHYGSGLTHARYSHEVGVTRIAVVCPVCGRCADARNGAADPHALVISHLAAAWQAAAWQARCQSCMWRAKDLTRAAVIQRPLYFASPYHDFWAWNREHLQWLLRVLQRADANTDAYARLRTYVPGHWLAARRRYARIVQRMLES